MKLGKDFGWIARIILAILKALLQMSESINEDTDGNGKDIE